MTEPPWLTLARELQAIAQTGLAFTRDPYDRERYEKLRALAAGLMADGAGLKGEQVLALFAQETGYATPKIDVRGAVFRDGRILLVRETTDGLWSLPGGWADVNQTARECVEREVLEESGYVVRAVKLAAAFDRARQGHQPPSPHSILKLFFVCELLGGESRTSLETSEIGFFAGDALPPLSLGRVSPAQIALLYDHWREPSLPTAFD